jgi:hypothetical protein
VAQINYDQFIGEVPGIEKIIQDENRHEFDLIAVLKEKKLEYI